MIGTLYSCYLYTILASLQTKASKNDNILHFNDIKEIKPLENTTTVSLKRLQAKYTFFSDFIRMENSQQVK